MLKVNKTFKYSLIASLLLGSLALSSCDKVADRLTPAKERTVNVGNADAPKAESIITYGVTDYKNLPVELQIPEVYRNNYINNINSYNILSTVYKNFLYRHAELDRSDKATNFLNELYRSTDDVKDVPKLELVIFYIDTMRNLQSYVSKGLNNIVYSKGIIKSEKIGEKPEMEKVAFLADITDNLNQITENFFLVNQFLTKDQLELDLNTYTTEYERFQNIKRLLKNQNTALIQYDQTCIKNPNAGDIINCLQTKFTVAYAALDTQLLSTFNYYLLSPHADTQDKEVVQTNLTRLSEHFEDVVEKNKAQFEEDLDKERKAKLAR